MQTHNGVPQERGTRNADAKVASVLGLAERSALTTTEALALQRSVASSLDCLRDEDTQSVYDNVNENDNLFNQLNYLSTRFNANLDTFLHVAAPVRPPDGNSLAMSPLKF